VGKQNPACPRSKEFNAYFPEGSAEDVGY